MKNPFDVHVGERLRLCRQTAGMSREEFGARIGVAARQIKKFEKGEDRIDSELLRDVVKVAGVSPAFFFEGLAKALRDVA